eukprot:160097-Chlamydomonas_euryale.AAC.1
MVSAPRPPPLPSPTLGRRPMSERCCNICCPWRGQANETCRGCALPLPLCLPKLLDRPRSHGADAR